MIEEEEPGLLSGAREKAFGSKKSKKSTAKPISKDYYESLFKRKPTLQADTFNTYDEFSSRVHDDTDVDVTKVMNHLAFAKARDDDFQQTLTEKMSKFNSIK